MFVKNSRNGVTVKAYRGDTMTLLAFDIADSLMTDDFVGFSIKLRKPSGGSYYLFNRLNFDGTSKEMTSYRAPFQMFRWLHVVGMYHQKINKPEYGRYTYIATPRYWDKEEESLKPIDPDLTVDVEIDVGRFSHKSLELGFARSFLTSQAYNRWFGSKNTNFIPSERWNLDTSAPFCTHNGKEYSYEDVYTWLGYTAREMTLGLLEDALNDASKSVDIFAYDFSEPKIASLCLELAKEGRIRMILDNSTSSKKNKKTGEKKITGHGAPDSPETQFEKAFKEKKTGDALIFRGRFSRYAHDKVIIVKSEGVPAKVLTGSTNFSITGFCVNANHIAIYDNREIAALYEDVFEASLSRKKMSDFDESDYSKMIFQPGKGILPDTEVTFSPHTEEFATGILEKISGIVKGETDYGAKSSVLFSVMQLNTKARGQVYPALREVQNNENIFSYGITDSTKSISLYKPGSKKGILVNAKSLRKILPPPFNEEARLNAHNIHHKFVVIDFNTPNARVYFGSSNLTLGGEIANGDNLVCVTDTDIATAFAIEAIRIIDHYHFRAKKQTTKNDRVLKLDTTSDWAKPYFNKDDIKYLDRKLFAS